MKAICCFHYFDIPIFKNSFNTTTNSKEQSSTRKNPIQENLKLALSFSFQNSLLKIKQDLIICTA
jgi:hypothetical protein